MQQKRTLGLVILRGETIVSVSVEGPPPIGGDEKSSLAAGPGRGMPAGRGMGLGAGKWNYPLGIESSLRPEKISQVQTANLDV